VTGHADVLGVVAAALLATQRARNVLKSITRVELIEVAWTLGVLLQPRAASPPVDDRLDAPCCVEQESPSSDMRSTSPQLSPINLTKLH